MKNILGGIRILFVALCVASCVFYTNLNYAQGQPQRISMDFQQAALKDVLKVFSQQSGLNFVATEEIENKRVTLYLDGVTVQDALDSIISANNLTYEQKAGSSVFIVKESTRPKVKMFTKVYNLNYIKIKTATAAGASEKSDIKSIAENLLTKDKSGKILGSVVVDIRTNSLIVTSLPEDFSLIEATLAKLDAQTSQVMIEAEIIEVKTTAIKKLGLEWGGSTSGTFFTFTGPSRDTGFPFIREEQPFARGMLGGALGDSRGRTVAASSTGTKFGNLTLTEFQVVLKALEKDNKAKYLAKPKIMVINNETAEIRISSNTAVGTTTTSQSTTGTITTTAERIETGIILKVTPTINKDNFITMTLEPEVSRIETASVSGYYDPAKRSAKTTVMMKDGQTVAIGGLLKSEITDNDRATPGLSKIPLLGNLFKSKDFQGIETEIIIFVSCHIVKPEIKTAEEVAAPSAKMPAKEAAVTQRDEEITKAVTHLRKKREIK